LWGDTTKGTHRNFEETEEVLTGNPGNAVFLDYLVYEEVSEDGQADFHEANH